MYGYTKYYIAVVLYYRIRLVIERLWVQLLPSPLQATLRKLTNLLCAQATSASYPEWEGNKS